MSFSYICAYIPYIGQYYIVMCICACIVGLRTSIMCGHISLALYDPHARIIVIACF